MNPLERFDRSFQSDVFSTPVQLELTNILPMGSRGRVKLNIPANRLTIPIIRQIAQSRPKVGGRGRVFQNNGVLNESLSKMASLEEFAKCREKEILKTSHENDWPSLVPSGNNKNLFNVTKTPVKYSKKNVSKKNLKADSKNTSIDSAEHIAKLINDDVANKTHEQLNDEKTEKNMLKGKNHLNSKKQKPSQAKVDSFHLDEQKPKEVYKPLDMNSFAEKLKNGDCFDFDENLKNSLLKMFQNAEESQFDDCAETHTVRENCQKLAIETSGNCKKPAKENEEVIFIETGNITGLEVQNDLKQQNINASDPSCNLPSSDDKLSNISNSDFEMTISYQNNNNSVSENELIEIVEENLKEDNLKDIEYVEEFKNNICTENKEINSQNNCKKTEKDSDYRNVDFLETLSQRDCFVLIENLPVDAKEEDFQTLVSSFGEIELFLTQSLPLENQKIILLKMAKATQCDWVVSCLDSSFHEDTEKRLAARKVNDILFDGCELEEDAGLKLL